MPNLRVSEVGCTNYEHNEEETRIIKTALSTDLDNLQHVESETNPVPRHKESLFKEIERYGVAISANERVPVEVLQQIFRFCCQGEIFDATSRQAVRNSRVMSLTRVCSTWRRVLLGTPDLWTNVRITDVPFSLNLATKYLSRGGNVPRSLLASFWGWHDLQDFLWRFPFREICFMRRGQPCIDFSRIQCESLEKLILRDGSPEKSPIPGPGMFPKLKVLEWEVSSILDGLNIVRAVPSLVSYTLRIRGSPQSPSTAINDVLAPNLLELALDFEDMGDVERFLDRLTVPNLTELSLQGYLACDLSTIREMASRSEGMQKLSKLVIYDTFWTRIEVGPLLQCLPSLQTLWMGNWVILDADVTQKIATGELGPALKMFRVYGTQDFNRMISMIELRREVSQCQPQRAIPCFIKVQFQARRGEGDNLGGLDELRENHRIDVRVDWV
ncbi:hypothetical protein AX15_007537 [Amanita polypyramis BW_CC]|nr:hypothetical protein AX15_007537 [Amanita polypyramis BW_CC]